MSKINVSYPYANALFKLANENNLLPEWDILLFNLKQISSDRQFSELINNPSLNTEDKVKIITELAQSTNPSLELLLKELIINSKISALSEIYDIYHVKYLDGLGNLEAIVESAYGLTDNDLKDIEKSLSNKFGKTINCKVNINTELLGGIKIILGDLVIDKSIKGNLNRLATEINK